MPSLILFCINVINLSQHPIREFVLAQGFQSTELRSQVSEFNDIVQGFFPWMDKLLEKVIENPRVALDKTRFTDAPFPIYADNDDSRNLISALSKPLQDLPRPSEDKFYALLDYIFGHALPVKTTLDDNDKKFIPLIKHILLNQIYSNKFDIPEQLEFPLVNKAFRPNVEVPKGIDMNKIVLIENEELKTFLLGYTIGIIDAKIEKSLNNNGLEKTVKEIGSSYSRNTFEFDEATDTLAIAFEDRFEELLDTFIKNIKSDDGLDDLPVDIADQVGAEVRDLVITGSVENSMLRPGEQEFFLDLLNGHLVYFEVISKMKTVTANRKLLLSKAGELENTDLQAAKVLRAVAD